MQLISLKKISLNFGTHIVLDNVYLDIYKEQKICLIGRNGTGKSSLLKVIEGNINPDSGDIIIHNNTKIASMIQEVPNDIDGSIINVILRGLGEMGEKLIKYNEVIEHSSQSSELESLCQYIDENQGWLYLNDAEVLASKLNLNLEDQFKYLSGGIKRRVLLAQALINKPDLLLLDEPTNHLDIDSIRWLEEFLSDFNGSLLFITHDRNFLNNVAKTIIELDRGNLYSFDTTYTNFLERKEKILDAQGKFNNEFDKRLAQEEAWINQGVKARRTRNEGRVKALKEMRSQRKQRRDLIGKVTIAMPQTEKSSKKIIQANRIGFKYQDSYIFQDFSTNIHKSDKIAIIGPNSCGKTTLLNCLLGIVKPTQGNVVLSDNIKISYFDQLKNQLNDNLSIIENVIEGSNFIEINGKETHIITYLNNFLFTPEKLNSPITHLSGGERNRLLLAKILSKPSNIIVLDEPTNDLDIETLELLEKILINYEGTIILISHDREFINNVATSTIIFEHGKINEYVGGYDDWLVHKKQTEKTIMPKTNEDKKNKLTYDQRKQLRNLHNQIDKLETNITKIETQIGKFDFYQKPEQEIRETQHKLDKMNEELKEKYLLWENLVELE